MKRLSLNIVYELLFIFMLISFSSCQDDDESGSVDNRSNLSLTLSAIAPEGGSAISMMTRGDETTAGGDNNYNENEIKSVDCFLYPTGTTDQNATVKVSATTIEDNTGMVTLNMSLSKNQVTNLFGSTNSCDIYVIANNSEHIYKESSDVNSLKETILSSDFKSTDSQKEFVMDGLSTVTLANDKLTGNVELSRSACKLMFSVEAIPDIIVDNYGKKWRPYPGTMSVKLINCLSKGFIDSDNNLYSFKTSDFFDYDNGLGFQSITDNNGALLKYDALKPFYSYPISWSNDINSKQPFFILILPFKKLNDNGEEEGDPVNYYYMVPVNKISSELKRNNCYHVTIKVGIMGTPDDPLTPSEHPSDEAELEDWSCVVNHWGSGDVNVDIFKNKYLVVDKQYVQLDNRNSAEVHYISSDDVKITYKITRQDVSNETATTITITDADVCTLDKVNNKIIYNKILENNTEISDKSYDFTPYTTTVTISHINDSNFSQTVTFIQYPLLYIIAQQNSNGTSSSKDGYVYVNYNNKTNGYGGVSGISGSNSNPNMYIISLSYLDSDSKYIIGDPRSRTKMSDVSWSSSANAVEGGNNRKLINYYPTESSERTINMIAPKFRIASSYGKTSPLSYANAQKRCASYQEDGYPAGRWRIPTQAELEYMIKLSSDNKIPQLLSISYSDDTSYYWSANGYVFHDGNGGVTCINNNMNSGSCYVRCVYDEWYWTDTVNKNTFTWGDKEIW